MSTVPMNCRRCGMKFTFPVSQAVFPCPACGALHERPQAQQEIFEGLDRANDLRADRDFTSAEAAYQDVLQHCRTAHEALWGKVLCRYGVEYVDDPATSRRMPTLHFLQRKSILSDEDFIRACRYASEEIAAQYREDAEYIEKVQRTLMQGEEALADCDVFLCYKGSGPDGKGFAKEYEHAFKLYMHLEKLGFRVFFAHESLKKAVGAKYEAGIFRALHSAKVMLVICSDPANLTTAWVHSEWSRFLKRFYEGENCRLIPLLYDNCDAYSLPQELGRLQGIDMSDPDAFEVLRENLRKYVPAAKPAPAVVPAQPAQPADEAEAEKLLTIEYALANGHWADAEKWSEALIRKQPRCSQAYFMKLLAKLHVAASEQLGQRLDAFEQEQDWKWALRFATDSEKKTLDRLLKESLAARERKRREDEELRRQEEEKRREAKKRREEERLRRLEEERQANERWEQEQKRLEEAAVLAEAKRREEEERRKAEEEKQRKAAARRKAEEQEREYWKEQRYLVQAELEMCRWDEAQRQCKNLPEDAEGLMLRLFTKYHVRPERSELKDGFSRAHPDCFKDPMWQKLLACYGSDSHERERLLALEEEGRAYWRKKKAGCARSILGALIALILPGAIVYGCVRVDMTGCIALWAAATVFTVYLLLIMISRDKTVSMVLWGGSAVAFMLCAAYVQKAQLLSDQASMWAAAGLSAFTLLILVFRYKTWAMDMYEIPVCLPTTWLILHIALNLLYGALSWSWLLSADRIMTVWLVPIALVILVFVEVKHIVYLVKHLRY